MHRERSEHRVAEHLEEVRSGADAGSGGGADASEERSDECICHAAAIRRLWRSLNKQKGSKQHRASEESKRSIPIGMRSELYERAPDAVGGVGATWR
jgi:hypothetical protein